MSTTRHLRSHYQGRSQGRRRRFRPSTTVRARSRRTRPSRTTRHLHSNLVAVSRLHDHRPSLSQRNPKCFVPGTTGLTPENFRIRLQGGIGVGTIGFPGRGVDWRSSGDCVTTSEILRLQTDRVPSGTSSKTTHTDTGVL